MSSSVHSITFDCADPYTLSLFWTEVTGYREDPADPNNPGDPAALLRSPDGGPALLFVPVPEGNLTNQQPIRTSRSGDKTGSTSTSASARQAAPRSSPS
jgi:hypothetical protein